MWYITSAEPTIQDKSTTSCRHNDWQWRPWIACRQRNTVYMGCSDVSEFEPICGQIFTTPSCVYDRLFTWTKMVDFDVLIVWKMFIDICFFDNVKSFGIDSCLYEIPVTTAMTQPFCRPRISVTHFASLRVPLDALFAVDQRANPAYPGFDNGGGSRRGAWPGGSGRHKSPSGIQGQSPDKGS